MYSGLVQCYSIKTIFNNECLSRCVAIYLFETICQYVSHLGSIELRPERRNSVCVNCEFVYCSRHRDNIVSPYIYLQINICFGEFLT